MSERQSAAPGDERPGRSIDASSPVLAWAIAALALVYVALFIGGVRFFVFKTAILPVFLVYGALLRVRRAFVLDWFPLLSATLLFDALRGAIYRAIRAGYLDYHVHYVIALETWLFGVPAAPLWLRRVASPWLDAAGVLVHASHFAFFLLFGLVLWHTRSERFAEFRRGLVILMALGLVGYAAVPTAPPWLAAQEGAIPPVPHVAAAVYTHHLPGMFEAFATNPVAAMPSLHVAFPALCALVGWRAFGRRAGVLLSAYVAAVAFAAMYLGEHYAVDVLAGLGAAGLAAALAHRVSQRAERPLVLAACSVAALAAAVALVVLL